MCFHLMDLVFRPLFIVCFDVSSHWTDLCNKVCSKRWFYSQEQCPPSSGTGILDPGSHHTMTRLPLASDTIGVKMASQTCLCLGPLQDPGGPWWSHRGAATPQPELPFRPWIPAAAPNWGSAGPSVGFTGGLGVTVWGQEVPTGPSPE